jgi:transcriptional regulator GlxA family with amidase domain
VTDQAQWKLKKVIEFVDENFTSDISREGLAAAVDLSPNYMSRLFISYKGKTINEYINELRIKFALERLENSDQKVLDIALEAGYENLTTFNRAFKKIAGRTPSEYRLTLP